MKITENSENFVHQSYWKKGKEEYKKFGDYHVKKGTYWKTTMFGILLTVLVLFPLASVITIFLIVFFYNAYLKLLLILLTWILVLFANGLSNYFTVRLTKNYITDDPVMQAFDEKAICFYNIFNIGFMIFTLVMVIIVAVGV